MSRTRRIDRDLLALTAASVTGAIALTLAIAATILAATGGL